MSHFWLALVLLGIGSLLAGVLLHTVGWATSNLLLLPFVLVSAVTTWRWRRRTLPDTRLTPADAV